MLARLPATALQCREPNFNGREPDLLVVVPRAQRVHLGVYQRQLRVHAVHVPLQAPREAGNDDASGELNEARKVEGRDFGGEEKEVHKHSRGMADFPATSVHGIGKQPAPENVPARSLLCPFGKADPPSE